MLRHVYWKFAVNPWRPNKEKFHLGQLVTYSKDYWHVLFNMEKLAKAGERNGYFLAPLGAKSCLYGTSDGFEFQAYIGEYYDEKAQLVMAAMIGLVEESPNFRTIAYRFTEVEL